jgi:hypothetical protein
LCEDFGRFCTSGEELERFEQFLSALSRQWLRNQYKIFCYIALKESGELEQQEKVLLSEQKQLRG